VKWAESRLEGFIEVVGMEMGVELGGNDAFQGFGRGTGGWRWGDS